MRDPVIIEADCLAALRYIPSESVHAVITDPPYGLAATTPVMVADTLGRWLAGDRAYLPTGRGFMGREWDSFVPPPAVWDECLRVLKPGGHLLAFARSRTADLMGLSVRLAGFDIRDTITWHYGNGFPKSLDIGKAIGKAASAPPNAKRWAGWGTAIKPASEPIIVARKPFGGTVAANVLAHGTGGLNIDACRLGTNGGSRRSAEDLHVRGPANTTFGPGLNLKNAAPKVPGLGRWPANVVLSHAMAPDGSDACADGCVPGCPIAELDQQSGHSTSPPVGSVSNTKAHKSGSMEGGLRNPEPKPNGYGDSGGASRFFPTFRYQTKAATSERPRTDDGTVHPTIKPLALMRWLVALVTAPGQMILDPFAGSGATGQAAVLEGRRSVLIERDPNYVTLIHKRLGIKIKADTE